MPCISTGNVRPIGKLCIGAQLPSCYNGHSFFSKTNEMHQFLKFILFCSSTLHVSNGLSVHHQESKTVHTASGICQTDSA